MTYLPSIPGGSLFDILVQYPQFSDPLHVFLENLLREDGPFSPGEREMIASYVSGVNECNFCCNTHTGVAEALGTPQGLVGDLLTDIEGADIADNMKPILRYVRKLTQAPASVGQADVDAILEQGWQEDAVVFANLICGAFNLFNRWVEGLGVDANANYVKATIKQLLAEGYLGVNDMVAKIRQRKKA
jgi:uncharacterized peroxidase-related enzyme